MNNFKIGDTVRLVDTNNLQQECRPFMVGDEAVVVGAWESTDGTSMIKVTMGGLLVDRAFYAKRFALVEAVEYPVTKSTQKPKNVDIYVGGRTMTLPTGSADRKNYPLAKGCLEYFPAALSGVANISKAGNDKHNPGEPLHHARGKSMDHADCIVRHMLDAGDLLAAIERGDQNVKPQDALNELNQMAWRALALSQEIHEEFGAPLAPGAKK
jgi:hypothetical protein